MASARVAITLNDQLLAEVGNLVSQKRFGSRSQW